jgi:hypothetical protein
MAGSIVAAAEQNAANNVLGLVSGFVSQYGGEVVEEGSLLTAAGKAALPFGIGKLMSSDSVEASNALVDAFGTTDAMSGYFGAALDPTVGQIVAGMIEDPTTITAAQYGTIGQEVRGRIQDNVESGMPLNTAQNEAIDFFQPQAAVSTPITSEVTSGTSFEPANPDGSFVTAPSISLAEAPVSAPPQTAFPVTPTPPPQPAITSPVVGEVDSGTSFVPVGMLGQESISLAETPAPAAPPTAFPVTPQVTTPAVTSPVVGEVDSGTSFEPANPDGSFVTAPSISLAEAPVPAPPPTAFPVTPQVTTPAVTTPVNMAIPATTPIAPAFNENSNAQAPTGMLSVDPGIQAAVDA